VYQTVLRREAAAGRLISLDPNIRPDLINDPDGYRTRFHQWLPSVGLLKVSDEDAAWLALGDGADHSSEWLASGVGVIVVTRGEDGMTAITPAGTVSVPGVRTVVVDTIGAGDTTHAALLARLYALGALSRDGLADLDRDGWLDVLGFAALAASITCSRAGAESPTAAELNAAGPVVAPSLGSRH
jgi:fructokinase